jgi:hypothetical protein
MAFAGESTPPTTLSGAAASRKDHRRSAAHATATRSRFPQLADRPAEQAAEGRSPNGSAAASAGTWPSPPPALPDPTSWTSTSTAPPETTIPPSPGSSAGLVGASAYVRTQPAECTPTSPAPASAMAACPATTWTSAPKAATFSLHRPRSALSPTGSSSGPAAIAAWTGPQSPGSWNPSANSNIRIGARPQARPQPFGPMGREPARRQPQRRPVLGRQPRARRRLRRRPQPPGYRSPQGRPRGAGDHADSRLRAQDKPGPRQMLCASSGTSRGSAAEHRG